jgi:predicted RNA methylase
VVGLILCAGVAWAQPAEKEKEYTPEVGQSGKDVVWVPTAQTLVNKMLDMAKLTPKDILYDLGSGDGRTVITAARRGARAYGIEYNPDMGDWKPDQSARVNGDVMEGSGGATKTWSATRSAGAK